MGKRGGLGGRLLDLRKGLENGTVVSFGDIWYVFEGSFDFIVERAGGEVEEFVLKSSSADPPVQQHKGEGQAVSGED